VTRPGYASLVRELRKSGLLDDRRRGRRRRSVISELGNAVVTVTCACCQAFSKVSKRCQVAPEVNKISLLAIARIRSSGHHSSLRKLDSRNVAIAIT
jgi:hypothetical protein